MHQKQSSESNFTSSDKGTFGLLYSQYNNPTQSKQINRGGKCTVQYTCVYTVNSTLGNQNKERNIQCKYTGTILGIFSAIQGAKNSLPSIFYPPPPPPPILLMPSHPPANMEDLLLLSVFKHISETLRNYC